MELKVQSEILQSGGIIQAHSPIPNESMKTTQTTTITTITPEPTLIICMINNYSYTTYSPID